MNGLGYNEDQQYDKSSTSTEECFSDAYLHALP
jgi:hypothetical protein